MAATAVPAAVDQLAKLCVDSGAAGNVQSLLDEMQSHGLAYIQKVHCHQILISRCNRNGDGVDPWDVQENVSDVANTKFHQKLFKGLITDIPASDYDATIAFNIKQVEASNGILADVEARKATHVTLWGGHTTQGFRSVLAERPHWDTELCVDGRLSIIRVAQKCPAYAEAIKQGAEYLVIPSWFLSKYAGLDDVVQAAGNVLQNVSKSENDLQMLRKLAGKIGSGQNFDSIKAHFKKNRPKNLAALPHMFNFLRKFPDAQLLNHMIQHIKSVGGQSRTIDGAVYDALQTDFKGPLQAPSIRFGVLGALYGDKKEKLVTHQQIKSLGSDANIKATLSAETEITGVADKIKANDKTSGSTWAWLSWSQLCSNVACMLVKKNTSCVDRILDDAKQKRDFMVHTGHLQLMCINAIKVACEVQLTDAFNEYVIKSAATDKPAPAEPCNPQTRVDADLTEAIMIELGFKVDDCIVAVKKEQDQDEHTFKIESMSNGIIKLTNQTLKKPGPSAELSSFQQKQWKHASKSKGSLQVYKEEYSQHNATFLVMNVIKSASLLAIYQAWNEETLQSGEVEVVIEAKGVIAKEKWGANELTLSPNSHTVSMKELKPTENGPALYSAVGVLLGFSKINGKSYVVTASGLSTHLKIDTSRNTKETLMVPYWNVDVTDSEDKANMKLTVDLSKHVIQADDVKILVPCMKNTKVIKPGDRLVLFVKSDKPVQPAYKKQKTMQ